MHVKNQSLKSISVKQLQSLKEQNSKETCRPNIEELVDITILT